MALKKEVIERKSPKCLKTKNDFMKNLKECYIQLKSLAYKIVCFLKYLIFDVTKSYLSCY